MNGVLEGRERLAGGETTGSSARLDLPQNRAPAGAREACTLPAPTMTSPLLGCFSRPFWALGSPIQVGAVVNPVVAPPANFSRASGTNSTDQFTGISNMISDQFIDVSKLIQQPSTRAACV